MPPEDLEPGSAEDWLRRARSDLALEVMYNDLCFHAQQAVEKSLKAVLIMERVDFRRVHHIGYLLGLLPQGIPQPPEAIEAVTLTSYAVTTRYPGDYEEITGDVPRSSAYCSRHC